MSEFDPKRNFRKIPSKAMPRQIGYFVCLVAPSTARCLLSCALKYPGEPLLDYAVDEIIKRGHGSEVAEVARSSSRFAVFRDVLKRSLVSAIDGDETEFRKLQHRPSYVLCTRGV